MSEEKDSILDGLKDLWLEYITKGDYKTASFLQEVIKEINRLRDIELCCISPYCQEIP